jgi:N-acetylglucosaminyl-diphospho-decaprenol L-rhamnosyltransferase
MNKNLTIIILAYNSSHMIESCLKNLDFDQYEVIVIDNASIDDSIQIVQNKFPKAQIIKLKKNIGYGRANNVALRQVKTAFALLMNVDSIITCDNINQITTLMAKNPTIAIAGPMVYSCKLENGNIAEKDLCTKINYSKHKNLEDENFYFSQFITGAAMFFNMKIMSEIGFFDEGFFLYCEDNEICKRAIKKGYKTAIVKNSKFYHLSGQSCTLTEEEAFRLNWHRFGWSKAYYTEKRWGILIGKLKAITMILKFGINCLKEKIISNKVDLRNQAALQGSYAYLTGLGAFDENDEARGIKQKLDYQNDNK